MQTAKQMGRNVRQSIEIAVVAGLFLMLLVAPLQAEKPAAEQPASGFDPLKMEELMTAAATPGAEHALLKELVGEWETTTKCYIEKPGEVCESTGKATFQAILGGRFVQQKYKGTMGGKPFSGVGITGYDNVQKSYIGYWIDTMGTGMMTTTGTYNADTKTMTEKGDYLSPIGKMSFRMEMTKVTDNQYNFTMYMTIPGVPEMKSMEMIYNRVN